MVQMFLKFLFQSIQKRGGICFLSGLIFCGGCVSVPTSQYLQDKHPYTKEYYVGYTETLNAVKKVLANNGWKIAKTTDPAVFEATAQNKPSDGKKVLLLTENKQTSLVLFSRYSQLNIYVRALKNSTEVEIRFKATTPILFKQFRSYRNDGFINKLFVQIHEQIHPQK